MKKYFLFALAGVSLSACMETTSVHTHYHYETTYTSTSQCQWQLYDPRITEWANRQLRSEYTPSQLTKMGFENKWTCVENH
jgi:hypothetical protein